MSPGNDERRPTARSGVNVENSDRLNDTPMLPQSARVRVDEAPVASVRSVDALRPNGLAGDDLRRRRDAADRLPPMACGRRDPLDGYRRDEGVPLHVYLRRGERYSLVRGWLRPLLASTTIRCHWSPVDRGWLVRTDRVDDVLALAELHGGYVVVVHEVEGAVS